MLPKDGGVFDQDEDDVQRLLAIYRHLDEWREQEMKRQTAKRSED